MQSSSQPTFSTPSPAPSGLPAWQRHLVRSWGRRGPLAWLLWPVSLVLRVLVRVRQLLYRTGLRNAARVPVPVIVVGNVVAGGAGKTPVVLALVRHLLAQGWHPGVIARGHGRDTLDCCEVTMDSPPQEVGDEPALIRRQTGVPVFVARQRAEAARALLAQYPTTNVLISDDGLQHLALARDIEICVFDDRGTGNGFLLPAGPLREPWPRPVDLVLHSGNQPAFAGYRAQRALAAQARRANGQRMPLATLAGSRQPLLALAGIAQPQAFFDMLRAQGLPLAHTIALPDHADLSHWHPPSDQDYTLLCTEKDAIKLWQRYPEAWAVPLAFAPEPAFLAEIDRRLARAAKAASARLSSADGHTTA